MKKGLTLIELLVVVVVIVTLLGVTFRLAGVGSDSTARNRTVNRLQRLENCLSGYYAAYGSYPPVKLHASRDYTLKADKYDRRLQTQSHWAGDLTEADKGTEQGQVIWASIDAAMKAQPIGMSFPFNQRDMKNTVSQFSQMKMRSGQGGAQANFMALINPSDINDDELRLKTNWQELQVFKFGVLSYLLPRYLLIMGGDTDNEEFFTRFEQWKANNQLPPRLKDGVPFQNWKEVNAALKKKDAGGGGGVEAWMIAALPSQATCARWLPNLEGQLEMFNKTYDKKEGVDKTYGVELRREGSTGYTPLRVYSATGEPESLSKLFIPDSITILDGWDNEFYYYSEPPYQSYRLWSAGKNGKTFPPWLSEEELAALNASERLVVQKWISDDIVQMSN